MIDFESVSFTYSGAGKPCLKDVSFHIKKGELIILAGASGCGKSTVIKLINGLLFHENIGELSGKITIDAKDIQAIPLWQLAQTVGSVFQNPKSQFFNIDTTNEVLFGLENCGADHLQMEKALKRVTEDCGLQGLLDRNIFALSGGEKQRIACACAYAINPKVFVLDEPSSNLDSQGIRMLRELIIRLKEQGKTVILAEHRLWYAADLADRVFYINNGILKNIFTAEDFLNLSEEKRQKMGLRSINEVPIPLPESVSLSKGSGLTVSGLTAGYGKQNVWENINFTVDRGEIVAVTGENGKGKSTLARVLCGLQGQRRGEICFDAKALSRRKRREHSFLIMQDVNFQLFADSVLEEAMLGSGADEDQARELLIRMNLGDFFDTHPMALSGGQKQRLAIADAILSKKQLLIFDEPTSGLDYSHMCEVSRLMKELAAMNYPIILITHDGEFVRETGARVIAWNGGFA